MKTIALDINEFGVINCLWNDELPLSSFGELSVTRASNVEFNADSQQWEVRLASNPGEVAFSNPSRSTCIEWEINHINQQLLNQ